MEPFRIAAPLRDFSGHYPDAHVFARAAREGGESARVALARLWLSEGIPFAFQKCPAIYESIRTWLSTWLGVQAKEIGLTGSGRLGASLAPNKLGMPFGPDSDLDLFVVSARLFDAMCEDFRKWSFDFERRHCAPSNEREAAFWRDNLDRGQKLIQRGFLDQKMVPNLPEFPTIKKISQAMWLLTEKLKLTPDAPNPSSASIRCYSTWDGFVRQVALNLAL